ncbi:MAG: hypothetical protein J5881_00525 [Clostridia bacterium]|nr:hypothetical protein [Clostridia bacterium]
MEEFNTIEKVRNLFESVGGLGNENLFFVTCQDKEKVSGVAAGMEYPYDGLLINASEKGIGMFYLRAGALSGLFGLSNPAKMKLERENYVFIPVENIQWITVKNFALLNSKTKRIEINTVDGKSHKLYAKIDEKDFPYQKQNFTMFIEKYGNK